MTKEKLIAQIQACTSMRVSNSPFINDFLGLKPDKQEKVAAELADKKISLLVDNRVNSLGLLSCLWPQLEPSQKKEERRKSDVRSVIKMYGIAKVDFISQEEMDFIFADFDLRTWQWPWKDTQALLKLFSEEKQKEHLRAYVKDYICPLDDEGWEAFLTPMADEERYEVFKSLDLQDLKRLFIKELFFERVDFFSSYLSKKHLIAILQQIGDDYIYDCIYELGSGYKRFTQFLKKFSPENRKEAIRCLKPEQLSTIIKHLATYLDDTLELFPISDRLDLLEYLGLEGIKKTFVKNDGTYISFSLVNLFKRLSSQDRIPFIKIFDPTYLQLMNDWSNIANIINNFENEKDVVAFFEHAGPEIIEQTFIKYKYFLSSAVLELQSEKRFGFLRLTRQLYPELLDEILLKKKHSWLDFRDITKLLPKEQRSSFFDLFIESDLRSFCPKMIDSRIQQKLEEYLKTKNAGRLSSTPKNTKITEKGTLLFRRSVSIEEESQSYSLDNEPQEEQEVSELLLLSNSPLTSSANLPAQKKSTVIELARSQVVSTQSKIPVSSSSRPNNMQLDAFEQLKAKITVFAGQHASCRDLYLALNELRNTLKENFRNHERATNLEEKNSLETLAITTIDFLDDFMKALSPRNKLRLIVKYEKDTQDSKTLKTTGKCIAIIIIAALCLATTVALGLALEILIGNWTVQAGIVTGFANLFADTNAGLMVANVLGFGVLAGIGGAVTSGFLLFKPTPVEKALNHVVREARKIAEKEIAHDKKEEKSSLSLLLWGLGP